MLSVQARSVDGGPWVYAAIEDATFTLRGLTAGRWKVRASAVVGAWPVRAEVEVDAGSTVSARAHSTP